MVAASWPERDPRSAVNPLDGSPFLSYHHHMTTAWFSRFWDRLRSAFAGAESASYAYDNHRLMARKLALA